MVHAYGGYYFYEASKMAIYKKRINEREPKLWMTGLGCVWDGRILRDGLHGRAVLHNDGQYITAISVDDNTKLAEMGRPIEEDINDFKVLGNGQELVACLSDHYLWIFSYSVDPPSSQLLTNAMLEVYKEPDELGYSLALCPHSKFIAVSTRNNDNDTLMRVLLFELDSAPMLSFRAGIDFIGHGISSLRSLEFFGYHKNHLLLMGLTCNHPQSTLMVFDFNDETGEFVEVEKLRKTFDFIYPYKLVYKGGVMYSSDNLDRVLKIAFNLKFLD